MIFHFLNTLSIQVLRRELQIGSSLFRRMKFGEFATYGTDTRFQFVSLSRGKFSNLNNLGHFMSVNGRIYVGKHTLLCR